MLILTQEPNSATTRQTPRNHKASPSLLSPKFHAPLPPPSFLPPTLHHQYSLSLALYSLLRISTKSSPKRATPWTPVMSNPATDMPPGFRFHPTDEELILHYLRNRAVASPLPVSIIAEVDIYKFNPWDLPAKAVFGEQEWYFFSPRDRKYPNGIRPNRTAASGYWKATGTDKLISSGDENIGVKKALVFYKGRPPKGIKTDWIMHEYRLADSQNSNNYKPVRLGDHSMRLDDWVLCRIYKKRNHLSPAMVDQEQEDMCTDDSCVHMTQNHLLHQHHGIKIFKAPFTSNFLEDYSLLLSNNLNDQQELIRFGNNSLFGHSITNQSLINQSAESNDNGYLHPQFLQAESPVSFAIKCQSINNLEESSGSLLPLKKQNELSIFPNFSSQFYGSQSQCNLLNQPSFNLQ